MYESETTHLHPSLKKCLQCKQKLKSWYRRERTIKSLNDVVYLVSHVYCCQNKECDNYRKGINPEEESLLAIKGYNYGLDVVMKVGVLRFQKYKTWEETQKTLSRDNGLKISEREIGYLEQTYLALTTIIAKEDQELRKKLEKLTGLILAIDGIKPDGSNDVLYIIREIQTGQTLAAKVISQNVGENIGKLIQEIKNLECPILGIMSDKEPAITSAVASQLPEVPHQLCHYHYVKNLAMPMVEADSKLKKNDFSSAIKNNKVGKRNLRSSRNN